MHDGILTMTAFDLCLTTSQHASSKIHIAGVNTIKLKVVDKVHFLVLSEFLKRIYRLSKIRKQVKQGFIF